MSTSGTYGAMKRYYASTTMDGKPVTASGGVKIPYEAAWEFEGKSVPSREKLQRLVRVDEDLPEDAFERP